MADKAYSAIEAARIATSYSRLSSCATVPITTLDDLEDAISVYETTVPREVREELNPNLTLRLDYMSQRKREMLSAFLKREDSSEDLEARTQPTA